MTKLLCCSYWLLFALAIQSPRSLTADDEVSDLSRTSAPIANQLTVSGTEPHRLHWNGNDAVIAAAVNATDRSDSSAKPAARAVPEVAADVDDRSSREVVGHIGRAAANSDESDKRISGESAAINDSRSGRVAELYEDLEDSVVFEDTEAGGNGHTTAAAVGGGRLLDEQLQPSGHGNGAAMLQPVPVVDDESYYNGRSTEEYDAVADGGGGSAGEQDAVPAGTNSIGVHQRTVKFPDYVGSSSYRRGWPGGNVTRPEELFRFWDPYEWTATSKVSDQCADEVELYKTALRNGKMWAFKSKHAILTSSSKRYYINVYNINTNVDISLIIINQKIDGQSNNFFV